MSICYIVGAAAFCAPFSPAAEDFVIAADGGFVHLQQRGITPSLTVGDFDSLKHLPTRGEVEVFPVEKDDTDTMLAMKIAWERGWRTFHLLAGTGGRTDHTLANLQALLWLASRGGVGYLRGMGECFTVLQNERITFAAKTEGTLSVFAQEGSARGVTLQGVQYPLVDGTLCEAFPLGVSNHFTGERATVAVNDGTLLLCWSGTPADVVSREKMD